MAPVEFQGRDLEEAIARAAATLSLPQEELKFSVLSTGARGFLGLGRRKARILIDPQDPCLNLTDPSEGNTPPPKAETKTESPSPQAVRATDSPPERSVDKAADRGESAQPKVWADWSQLPPPPTRPGPEEQLRPAADDPQAALASELIKEIVSRLGLEVSVESAWIGQRLILSLDSPDRAILIGNRGLCLEALQTLTEKIFSRRLKLSGENKVPRLVLDVAQYRARRQKQLMDKVDELLAGLSQSRQPQSLGGLSQQEKRLIALALRPCQALRLGGLKSRDGLLTISFKRPVPRR